MTNFTQTEIDNMNGILGDIPQFVYEMDADWEMVVDFLLSQVSDLTDAEWQQAEVIFNDCFEF